MSPDGGNGGGGGGGGMLASPAPWHSAPCTSPSGGGGGGIGAAILRRSNTSAGDCRDQAVTHGRLCCCCAVCTRTGSTQLCMCCCAWLALTASSSTQYISVHTIKVTQRGNGLQAAPFPLQPRRQQRCSSAVSTAPQNHRKETTLTYSEGFHMFFVYFASLL